LRQCGLLRPPPSAGTCMSCVCHCTNSRQVTTTAIPA
jgi:hypothetical protein